MELFLRPLADVNDVTWSIIWCLVILLAGVFYVIVYILGIDERENGSNDTPEQEKLLQLPSSGDQQSPGR
jgi:Na+(H+)/acetate symporter ActP